MGIGLFVGVLTQVLRLGAAQPEPNPASAWISVLDHGANGGDTKDDTAGIQAAIDALPSTGGRVFFPSGRYYLDSSKSAAGMFHHIRVRGLTNVTLFGAGPSSEIVSRDPADTKAKYSTADPSLFYVDASEGIQFRDLSLGGKGKTDKVGDGRFACGVLFYSSTRCSVEQCSFRDLNNGIECWFSTWGRIFNNVFTGRITQSAIELFDNDYRKGSTDHHTITGNLIDGGATNSINMGIRADTSYTVIANNTIRNTYFEPILLEGTTSQHVSMTGNAIEQTGFSSYGIVLRNAERCVVSGNTIDGGGIVLWAGEGQKSTKWTVRRNIVSGNTINANKVNQNGIYVAATPPNNTASDNTFVDNMIECKMSGIHLSSTAGSWNRISGNRLVTEGQGITCETPHNQIGQNIISSGSHGIYALADPLMINENYLIGKSATDKRPVFVNVPNGASLAHGNVSTNYALSDFYGTLRASGAASQGSLQVEPGLPPAKPTKGTIYFDSTSNKMRVWDGKTWRDLW